MKEPYDQGLANRIDPAPCVDAREGMGEASVEGRRGLGIEPRKQYSETPTLWVSGEGNTRVGAMASLLSVSRGHRPQARVDAPRMGTGRSPLRPSTETDGPHRGGREGRSR